MEQNDRIAAANREMNGSSFVKVSMRDSRSEDAAQISIRFDDANLSRAAFDNGSLPAVRMTGIGLSGVSISDRDIAGLRVNGQLVSKLLQPIPGEGEKTDA